MAAGIAAVEANRRGWASLIVNEAADLTRVIELARCLKKDGGKVLVIVEDIDTESGQGNGSRSAQLNALLNSLDGPNKSLTEGMVIIMTTNFATRMDATMLRRVFLLSFDFPNAETRERMFRSRLGDFLQDGADISEAVKESEGYTGAFIGMACDLATRFYNVRGQDFIPADGLARFVQVIRAQRDQVYQAANNEEEPGIAEIIARQVHEALDERFSGVEEQLDTIRNCQ
jgi:hypothetical protein